MKTTKFIWSLALMLILAACSRDLQEADSTFDLQSFEYTYSSQTHEHFFNDDYIINKNESLIPAVKSRSLDPKIEAVKYLVHYQDGQKNFIPDLVNQVGYPLWSESEAYEYFTYVPFIKESSSLIEAYLIVKIIDNNYDFYLMKRNKLYASIVGHNDYDNFNGEMSAFLHFDDKLFSNNDILISDFKDTEGEIVVDTRCTILNWCNCVAWHAVFQPDEIEVETRGGCSANCAECICTYYIHPDCWDDPDQDEWGGGFGNTDWDEENNDPPGGTGPGGYDNGGGQNPPDWWTGGPLDEAGFDEIALLNFINAVCAYAETSNTGMSCEELLYIIDPDCLNAPDFTECADASVNNNGNDPDDEEYTDDCRTMLENFMHALDVSLDKVTKIQILNAVGGECTDQSTFDGLASQALVDILMETYPDLNLSNEELEWLVANPGAAAENINILKEHDADAYSKSSVEIITTLGYNDLLELTLPELQAQEALLESIINGTFEAHFLTDQTALAGTAWYSIFAAEWENGPSSELLNFFAKRLEAVRLAANEAWNLVLAPVTDLINEVFEVLPSTSEEWYVMACMMSPILLDLGLDFVPIVGDIKGFADAFTDFSDGNWQMGAIGFISSLAAILPVGDLIKSVPKVRNAFEIGSGAFRALRAMKNVASNVFTFLKSKIDAGWKYVWDDGILKIKNKFNAEVGEVSSEGIPTIKKKAFSGVIDPNTFKNLTPKPLNDVPSGNSVSGSFINENANKFNVTEPSMKSKFDDIVDNGDQYGKKTEELLTEVLEDSGDYVHYDGSYNTNNGFDGVFVKGDLDNPTEIVINESKQWTGGSVHLNGSNPGTNLPAQMTDDWVDHVRLELLATGDPDKVGLAQSINTAINNGNLTKIVTVVDRTPAGNADNLLGGINVIKVD